jgi:hypothetical protein
MKGAIVFLVVFAIVLIITLASADIPPGQMIYNAALPNTEIYTRDYRIAGTDAFHLIIGVFNGVIYGFIAWLIFTLLNMGRKKDKHQNIQQIVNVNVGDKKDTSPPPPPQ